MIESPGSCASFDVMEFEIRAPLRFPGFGVDFFARQRERKRKRENCGKKWEKNHESRNGEEEEVNHRKGQQQLTLEAHSLMDNDTQSGEQRYFTPSAPRMKILSR